MHGIERIFTVFGCHLSEYPRQDYCHNFSVDKQEMLKGGVNDS